MTTNAITFGVRTDLVVVGTNPEMADMTNPRGELVGEAHYIVGTAPNGARIAHRIRATTRNGHVLGNIDPERLSRLAERLTSTQPRLNEEMWDVIQPVYGSPAYVEGSWEEVALHHEREEDRLGF